ncbi:MAG: polysaccharide deacetylase family protein, partial [Steroidobacteraceae bacterium]
VLIYHRVLDRPDPLLPDEPDAAAFAAQMDLLGSSFNVLPLPEAVERLCSGALPARAVCITFDDGYSNNCDVALPILAARGLPATVFVAPGFLNGGRMFNDVVLEAIRRAPQQARARLLGEGDLDLSTTSARLRTWTRIAAALKYLEPGERMRQAEGLAADLGVELPVNLMMTDTQVRRLHQAGIEIGAHTMSHPILTRVDGERCLAEMVDSRRRLEEITGARVTSFAYPNGAPLRDYDRMHVALAREAGFDLAVSTAWGAATMRSDRMQLPRIAPWDRSARRYAMRLAAAYRQRRFQMV